MLTIGSGLGFNFMLDDKILKQNIIKELNLEALDEDKKIALLDKMSEIVQKGLTLRIIEEMNDEQKDKFDKILDEDPEKLSSFLQEIFPNFLEMIQEEIIKLKKEMINDFKIDKI